MTGSESGHEGDTVDPVLAKLVEQITCRLQSGERVDSDIVAGHYPAQAGSICELLSVLTDLTALGRITTGRRLRTFSQTIMNPQAETPLECRPFSPSEQSEQ
jgi:hypothetical protein